MDSVIKQTEIAHLRQQRIWLLSGTIALTILGLLLSVGLLYKERFVVLVPPQLHEAVSLSRQHLSDSYLVQMSELFLDQRFNKTPSNARAQSQWLLNYASGDWFDAFSTQLETEDEKYERDSITTAFYPSAYHVSHKPLAVEVEGDFQSQVGDITLPVKRLRYRLGYNYSHGHLLLTGIEQVKK